MGILFFRLKDLFCFPGLQQVEVYTHRFLQDVSETCLRSCATNMWLLGFNVRQLGYSATLGKDI